MIVVDTSALIAILQDEPEIDLFLSILQKPGRRLASAITVYEASIIIAARRGRGRLTDLSNLINLLQIEIVPFAEQDISAALEAYIRYGKGFNPKSRLNFGDCAAYALAKTMNAPLLFKGNDFAATDVQLA